MDIGLELEDELGWPMSEITIAINVHKFSCEINKNRDVQEWKRSALYRHGPLQNDLGPAHNVQLAVGVFFFRKDVTGQIEPDISLRNVFALTPLKIWGSCFASVEPGYKWTEGRLSRADFEIILKMGLRTRRLGSFISN